MSFDAQSVTRIVHMARADRIDPAALLAVAEVESAGRPLEADSVTPRLLFEKHVFYRALYKNERAKLQPAVAQGLAAPKWDRATQYREQTNSQGRLAILARARAVDEECANQACSWGLGQILGENAQSLGYGSATDMVNALVAGGIPAQVESMLRFIRKNNLKDKLNLHDWAGFALKYNGPGYLQNNYHTKMAAAYQIWVRKLDATVIPPPEPEAPQEPGPDMTPPYPTQEQIDELPPPYIEPKTPEKSKTLWSVLMQIVSVIGGSIGYALSDWRIMAAMAALIVFFAIFIGRERVRKIIEDAV